jgi:tRNA-dihydrouridine synthase A
MVTTGAIIHGNRKRFLQFDPLEHPIAVQLGGANPSDLAVCARISEDYGYDEINLNIGCPSDRVQAGKFGACLMAEPALVAECVSAISKVVSIPVTVKTRIGIDQQDSYEELCAFISTVAQAGCQIFIIHARKAWLKGLNPKENRTKPPLRYDVVYQLKRDFPKLKIIINGGIHSQTDIQNHLQNVDGVMIGRAAYDNPYFLAELEQTLFPTDFLLMAREQIVEKLIPYIERELQAGTRLKNITRHLFGLFRGLPGARAWRKNLGTATTFDSLRHIESN